MATATIDEEKLKDLLKSALVEALEEHRDFQRRTCVLKGEIFKGQDTFFGENRPGLGLQISLPQNVQVKSGGVNGLFMEQIYMDFKSTDLAKVANAKDVQVFLGKQNLNLSESQMSTL